MLLHSHQDSAATAFVTGRFDVFIGRSATAFAAVATEHGVNHGGGTADPGLHGNGIGGAIQRACAAFHAGIPILYHHMFAVHFKHFMGTNIQTHTASRAFVFVQLQRNNIFKVNRIFHFNIPSNYYYYYIMSFRP
jgi:hypothetical protein